VATRWTGRGTHDGEIAGIAATGKQVTVTGLTISTVENGLVVEEQTEWDALGMLVQLGAVPAPTPA
jgi:predicted ester cyclase